MFTHRLFFLLFFVLVLSLYLSISLNQIKNSTRLNYLSTGVESEHRSLHSQPYQRLKSNINITEKPRQGTKTSRRRRPKNRSIVRDSRKSSISSQNAQTKHQPKSAQFSHHTIFINLKNSFFIIYFPVLYCFFYRKKN